MTLKAVKGGWINTDINIESKSTMITQERKSKYKHKVIFTSSVNLRQAEVRAWCEKNFGPGGRSKKYRWRMGWTDKTDTYYFKNSKDAMLFTLMWS